MNSIIYSFRKLKSIHISFFFFLQAKKTHKHASKNCFKKLKSKSSKNMIFFKLENRKNMNLMFCNLKKLQKHMKCPFRNLTKLKKHAFFFSSFKKLKKHYRRSQITFLIPIRFDLSMKTYQNHGGK